MSKKKLTCHCGGVEGQVEVPETGFEKLCGVMLYMQKKGLHYRGSWSK